MENLKNKLNEGFESLIELVDDTKKFIPDATVKDCFPMIAYRNFSKDGKEYRITIECTLKEIK